MKSYRYSQSGRVLGKARNPVQQEAIVMSVLKSVVVVPWCCPVQAVQVALHFKHHYREFKADPRGPYLLFARQA
ncbi:MAG: hypothetical protein OXC42_01410 [Gammaproteobacteria bacterium]|nr:hypothetical protein [Gammaproteobacteria bacterium]